MLLADLAERESWLAASPPWAANSFRLVSLWDMLRFYASAFVELMRLFAEQESGYAQLQSDCAESQTVLGQLDPKVIPAKVHERLAMFHERLDAHNIKLIRLLDGLKEYLGKLHLGFSIREVDRVRASIEGQPIQPDALKGHFARLRERIEDELDTRLFFFVSPDRAKYLLETEAPFGKEVQDKFPELTGDIVDATWCLGVERSTAAVYHLMCATELAIRRLAKRLKIPRQNVEHKTWGQIFGRINPEIVSLPNVTASQKARKEKYAEAMAHLNNVKDAWRNSTMHSRRRYTQEEAEAIFENVKTFVKHLACKVL